MAHRVGGLRVLLAEDETLAALAIVDALAEAGHTVVHAADGETALGLAAAMPFDVLVTDLAMPRLSGAQLIPLLRAEHPGLPVVIVTGWLSPDGARLLAAPDLGRTELLLKPFAMPDLAAALARVPPHPPGGSGGTGPDRARLSGRPPDAAMPAA